MNDATRKRRELERRLAEKVLGATVCDAHVPGEHEPQVVWDVIEHCHWLHYDEDGRRWSPVTNFPDAFALLGRLVEKDGEAEIEFSGLRNDESGQAWASVEIGNRDGGVWADTPAEALSLAICEVMGISTEDGNGS